MIDLQQLPDHIRPTATRLAQDFAFEKAVLKGGNGVVLIGKNIILNRDMAVKFYYWEGGDHLEPALLSTLESPHILKVFHAEKIDDEEAFFTTAFCDLGDLDDALAQRCFGPLESLDIILQISAGASYIHGRGFLHRDLKPSNIFCLSDGRFVIGDFGSVAPQDAKGCARTLTRHSLLYRPPEEINFKVMCKQSDIYQIGIVLYQLLGGHLPYNEFDWLSAKQKAVYGNMSKHDRQFYASNIIEQKIVSGRLLDMSSLPAWVPLKLRSAIKKCTCKEKEGRFATVADFSAKMNNVRDAIPDWRIEEFPTLYRKQRKYRIVDHGSFKLVEKNVGNSWRVERSYKPTSVAEAVEIVEAL